MILYICGQKLVVMYKQLQALFSKEPEMRYPTLSFGRLIRKGCVVFDF